MRNKKRFYVSVAIVGVFGLYALFTARPGQAATELANLSWASGSQVNTASGFVSDTGNTVYLTNGVVNTTYTLYWAATDTGQTVNLGTCTTATLGTTCSRAITVPHATKGDWKIHAESTLDNSANRIIFTVNPKLTASSPSSGNVGTSTTVSGTGFANESVTAKLGTFTLGSATPGAGAGGSAGDLTVTAGAPEMPKGSYSVSAVGTLSGTINSAFTFVMNPKISLSSNSGLIGASTNISGNGFAASSTITITQDGGDTATTTTSNSLGTFSAISYTPTGSRGGHTIAAHDAIPNLAATVNYVIIDPIITISANTGFVGDSITLTGTAFKPSVTVTVYYDGVATATTTTSDAANGAFSGLSFTIPASIAGTHTISVRDTAGNTAPNKIFTVSAKITLSSSAGNVDSNTVLTGSGFAASSVVTIKWDGGASGPTITSGSTGSFSNLHFTIPTAVAGAHTINGTDASNNSAGNVTYTISPVITLGSVSGHAGDTTTISGTGFAASSTITVVFKGANTATTTTSSSTGAFSGLSFTIPPTELPATDTITAHDAVPNTAGNKNYVVVGATTPVITLTNYSGNVANSVTIAGNRFSLTATSATVRLDGINTATTCTVSGGNVSGCSYTLPATTAGTHTISLIDNATPPLTSATQNYLIIPKITVSAANQASGVPITITGTGFAGSSLSTILWDNANTATTTTSNSTGGFSVSFTILSSGTHTIRAKDAAANFSNAITNASGSVPAVDTTTAAQTSGGSETSFNLTENTTTTLYVHGAITDLDGCEDVAVNGTVTAKFYRTNHASGDGCSADNNDCYVLNNASCTKTSCTGPGDNVFNYECTAPLQYYADSTAQGPHAASNWTAKVTATDQALTFGTQTDTIEMNTLVALNVPANMNYGTIALDAVGTEQILDVTNTGNSGMDTKFQVNGDMICDGGGSVNIPAGNARYTGTTGFAWADGISLSTTLTEFEFNLGPRTSEVSAQIAPIYFLLRMPLNGVRGICTNTMSVVSSADTENGW